MLLQKTYSICPNNLNGFTNMGLAKKGKGKGRLKGKEQDRISITKFSLCLGLCNNIPCHGIAPTTCSCQPQAFMNPLLLTILIGEKIDLILIFIYLLLRLNALYVYWPFVFLLLRTNLFVLIPYLSYLGIHIY